MREKPFDRFTDLSLFLFFWNEGSYRFLILKICPTLLFTNSFPILFGTYRTREALKSSLSNFLSTRRSLRELDRWFYDLFTSYFIIFLYNWYNASNVWVGFWRRKQRILASIDSKVLCVATASIFNSLTFSLALILQNSTLPYTLSWKYVYNWFFPFTFPWSLIRVQFLIWISFTWNTKQRIVHQSNFMKIYEVPRNFNREHISGKDFPRVFRIRFLLRNPIIIIKVHWDLVKSTLLIFLPQLVIPPLQFCQWGESALKL